MTNQSAFFLKTGAVFLALAVVFGAFGAHIVEEMLTPNRFEVYKTAIQYHFYHALGLLMVGMLSLHISNKWIKWSGYSLITGILFFSGSLYLLTLFNLSWLGVITPAGGVVFIVGWLFLFLGVMNKK